MSFQVRDASDLQPAVEQQQRLGGVIELPAATLDTGSLFPFPPSGDSTRPLEIRGKGMSQSSLRLNQPNVMLISYGKPGNPKMPQLILSDLTLDGNYGVFPQPQTMPFGMVGCYNPFTSCANPQPPSGIFHEFRRVRFYRPQGPTFFPSQGVRLQDCRFEQCGQPDQAMHYDNLGSGDWTDAIVDDSLWINSAGNYADFVGSDAGPVRITFRNNVSRNHKQGGIYACGVRSLVTGNDLQNVVAGGGIGYDSTTSQGCRSRNVVTSNTLVGMNVLGSGLSKAHGDVVEHNLADDVAVA